MADNKYSDKRVKKSVGRVKVGVSPRGGGQASQTGMHCLAEFTPICLHGHTPGLASTLRVNFSLLAHLQHKTEGQLQRASSLTSSGTTWEARL